MWPAKALFNLSSKYKRRQYFWRQVWMDFVASAWWLYVCVDAAVRFYHWSSGKLAEDIVHLAASHANAKEKLGQGPVTRSCFWPQNQIRNCVDGRRIQKENVFHHFETKRKHMWPAKSLFNLSSKYKRRQYFCRQVWMDFVASAWWLYVCVLTQPYGFTI